MEVHQEKGAENQILKRSHYKYYNQTESARLEGIAPPHCTRLANASEAIGVLLKKSNCCCYDYAVRYFFLEILNGFVQCLIGPFLHLCFQNPRTSFLDHIGSSAASSETEKVLGAEEREGDRDWEGEGSRQKEERGTRKREGELKARGKNRSQFFISA